MVVQLSQDAIAIDKLLVLSKILCLLFGVDMCDVGIVFLDRLIFQ